MAFLTKSGSDLFLDGQSYKNIGFNVYNALNTSNESIVDIFSKMQYRGNQIMRMWCFDFGKPPSDSGGNFRFTDYPLSDNLISNNGLEPDATGWTFQAGFSRNNEDAHTGSWGVKQVSASGFNDFRTGLINVTQNTNYTLTFWYKQISRGGSGPKLELHNADSSTLLNGGLLEGSTGEWVRRQTQFNSGSQTQMFFRILNWNGNVTFYYDDFTLNIQQTPILSWREATLKKLDFIANEAQKHNIKLHLVFADNTPNYDTKKTYVDWANSLYGAGISNAYPYIGFFENSNCKQLYKDFLSGILNRTNTINGRVYKNDDSIGILELGNELRTDRFEGANVNSINSENLTLLSKPGGWIDEMTTYIKSIDSNHLTCFSSCSHGYQHVTGDTVWNGTFYGVDYNIIATLPNLDILSFHCYPTQGGGETQLIKYGQKLGFPNAVNGPGFKAQMKDYIRACVENEKVSGMGETGLVKAIKPSTEHYPLWPRHLYIQQICRDWLDQGGSFINFWSATNDPEGGSYSIVLEGVPDSIQNLDDRPLMSLIHRRNFQLKGERLPIIEEYGLTI